MPDTATHVNCVEYLMSKIENWSQLAPSSAVTELAETQLANLSKVQVG